MDIFKVFVIPLVIQILCKSQADVIVSSLLGSVNDVRCASPFLSFNRTGYIQCLKTCISYSRCDVVRYSKSHLECYIYNKVNCWSYSGDPESSIYIQRDDIDESIGSSCRIPGCPAANLCVMLIGYTTCLPDQVPTPYAGDRATFTDIDGVYFWMYPVKEDYAAAKRICESTHGRLAVLDTTRKINLANTEANKHLVKTVWFVGGTLVNDEWQWSTGMSISPIGLNYDGDCCALYSFYLHDSNCNIPRPFVCETM